MLGKAKERQHSFRRRIKHESSTIKRHLMLYVRTCNPSSAFKSAVLVKALSPPPPLLRLYLWLLPLPFARGETRRGEVFAHPLGCGDKSAGANPLRTTPLANAEKYSCSEAHSVGDAWSLTSASTRAMAPSRAACRYACTARAYTMKEKRVRGLYGYGTCT